MKKIMLLLTPVLFLILITPNALAIINIDFVNPTPNNASRSTANIQTINATISSSVDNISSCLLEWNGTNETMLIEQETTFSNETGKLYDVTTDWNDTNGAVGTVACDDSQDVLPTGRWVTYVHDDFPIGQLEVTLNLTYFNIGGVHTLNFSISDNLDCADGSCSDWTHDRWVNTNVPQGYYTYSNTFSNFTSSTGYLVIKVAVISHPNGISCIRYMNTSVTENKQGTDLYCYLEKSTIDGQDYLYNVHAIDTSSFSNESVSREFTENSLPIMSTVDITPSVPNDLDDLTCTVSSTDSENDIITYHYYWYKDDVLQLYESSTSTTSIITSGNTSIGEVWNCTVLPDDGYENGTSTMDDTATIVIGSQVTACGTLTANGIYSLQNDVSSTDSCFLLEDNVTFNGNNYTIHMNCSGFTANGGQSNVTISNVNIISNGTCGGPLYAGIFVNNIDQITISNTNIISSGNHHGLILFTGTNDVTMNDINITTTGSGHGIFGYALGLLDLTIDGLYMDGSSLVNSNYGIYNIVGFNVNINDFQIYNYGGGILLYQSSGATLTNGIIGNINVSGETGFGVGMSMYQTNNTYLENIEIFNTSGGAFGYTEPLGSGRPSENHVAINMTVSGTGTSGLYFQGAKNVTVSESTFTENGYGLSCSLSSAIETCPSCYSDYAEDILLFNNTWIDNVVPNRVSSPNIINMNFNDTYYGNSWSDYTGCDNDSDNIGDTPYIVNETLGLYDYLPYTTLSCSGPPSITGNLSGLPAPFNALAVVIISAGYILFLLNFLGIGSSKNPRRTMEEIFTLIIVSIIAISMIGVAIAI